MSPTSSRVIAYRFGPFRLIVADRILEHDAARVQLTPKVIDTLFVLVQNAPQVVTKEALMQAVWPDVTVVESGLTRNISALRKALQEGAEEGAYLETIPRRGYRFVAEVVEERFAPPETPESELASQHGPDPLPVPLPVAAPPRSRLQMVRWAVVALLAAALLWLVPRPGRIRADPPQDPAVRIGEHLLAKLAPQETIRAVQHFEQGIAANNRSAAAHAGLSVSLLHLSMFGVETLPAIMPRAEQAARTALELDPELGTAQYAMASVRMLKQWDLAGAEAGFRRALELSPQSAPMRLGYAQLRLAAGDAQGALRLVEEALRLDPASPALGSQCCRVYYFLRDFRRAEAECKKVLDREPHYALAHYYLALSLAHLRRFEEARDSLRQSALMPGVLAADNAWIGVLEGDRRPALAVLEERRELLRQARGTAAAKLLPAAILGRFDEAYEALDAGVAQRAPELLFVPIEPRLDSLRTDPRWEGMVRRIRGRAP